MNLQEVNSHRRNVARFEELMGRVKREGRDELLKYIREETDFYTAPASTSFHLACEGGLLQHSLNVYDCLVLKRESPVWEPILSGISDETLIIVSLLHDLCKANTYVRTTRNVKTYDTSKVDKAEKWQIKHDDMGDYIWESVPGYKIEDNLPLGHGEKSALVAKDFLKLTQEETMSIRWHMAFSEEKAMYGSVGKAMELYPLTLALHMADMEASKLFEDVFENKLYAEMVATPLRVQRCEMGGWGCDTVVSDDECPFK